MILTLLAGRSGILQQLRRPLLSSSLSKSRSEWLAVGTTVRDIRTYISHDFQQKRKDGSCACTTRRQLSGSSATANNNNRPFQILGVQQIALGSTNKEGMTKLWNDVFGFDVDSSHHLPKENVQEDIIKVGPSHALLGCVEIDLMQPIDPEKSPKVHVPPLNHFGLWVDHLEEAVTWMEQQGVRFAPGGIRKGAAGYNVAFIHPKGNETSPISGNGVLIELVQAPQNIIDAFYNK